MGLLCGDSTGPTARAQGLLNGFLTQDTSGSYAITVSGATSSDYTIVFRPGTLTVQEAPLPPLVVVQRVQVKTVKVGKKSTTVLVVTFSGDVDSTSAQATGNYHLTTAGKDKKYGTKDDKGGTTFKAAAYNLATHAVTLTPKAVLKFAPSFQLRLSASAIRDKLGQSVDGDNNGSAGGDSVVIVTKKSV